MKDNHQILNQSIDNLPVYKPDGSVFDRLGLNLSEFPVNGMQLYSPKNNLWNEIKSDISLLDRRMIFRRDTLRVLLVVLLLTLALGYLYHEIYSKTNETYSLSEQLLLNSIEDAPNETNILNTDQIEITKKKLLVPAFHQKNSSSKFEGVSRINNQNISNSNIQLLKENKSITSKTKNSINYLERINLQLVCIGENANADIILSSSKLIQDDMACSDFTGSSGYFTLGLSGSFDYFIQGEDLNSTSNLYWSSVNAYLSYHRNRMYYTTGIGVVFSSDFSTMEHNYLQNELVNTYENVDSIYYDPETGLTEFFTVTVEVYDSIEYVKEVEVKTAYNYIQFPLSVGYKFINKQKYSIGVATGFTYLHLIKQNEYLPSLQIDDARTLNITYTSPQRRENLFRFDVQFDLSFKLTQNIYTIISPAVNIYNSSIYTDNTAPAPVSFRINGGIFYRF